MGFLNNVFILSLFLHPHVRLISYISWSGLDQETTFLLLSTISFAMLTLFIDPIHSHSFQV